MDGLGDQQCATSDDRYWPIDHGDLGLAGLGLDHGGRDNLAACFLHRFGLDMHRNHPFAKGGTANGFDLTSVRSMFAWINPFHSTIMAASAALLTNGISAMVRFNR